MIWEQCPSFAGWTLLHATNCLVSTNRTKEVKKLPCLLEGRISVQPALLPQEFPQAPPVRNENQDKGKHQSEYQ